ncbi:MAG: hypothetical protein VKM01_07910 [Cyanobacteriota bacterium]|nr:hypothetical protein [Cyanobacteriota bacterium]
MPTESVSFRISRSAEDLAETIHALSHRLVRLEQRLGALELQIESQTTVGPDEWQSLERVGQLLADCRQLLDDGTAAESAVDDGDAGRGGPTGFGGAGYMDDDEVDTLAA